MRSALRDYQEWANSLGEDILDWARNGQLESTATKVMQPLYLRTYEYSGRFHGSVFLYQYSEQLNKECSYTTVVPGASYSYCCNNCSCSALREVYYMGPATRMYYYIIRVPVVDI